MPLSEQQATELAKAYTSASARLGQFRSDNIAKLSPGERSDLEHAEWTMIGISSKLITTAVGLSLDAMEGDLNNITEAANKALSVVRSIDSIQNILTVSGAMITMGGAIASGHPQAIISAATALSAAADACTHHQ